MNKVELDDKTMGYLDEMVQEGVFSSREAAIAYIVKTSWIQIIKIQKLHKKGKGLPIK